MINTNNLDEARRQVEKIAKEKKEVVVQGKGIEFNRKILEMKKVNTLVLQHKYGKDMLKQRDSGLNHVLCNIAGKNNITLAVDFSEISNSEGKEKAKIISRVIQNIRLIGKAGNKMEILNKPKDRQSLQALFLVLGADTNLAAKIAR